MEILKGFPRHAIVVCKDAKFELSRVWPPNVPTEALNSAYSDIGGWRERDGYPRIEY